MTVRRYEQLDVNNKLIWNFRDIGHTLRSISEGKGGQKRILILLSENGSITQSVLTGRLGLQSGSVSEVLGKLEASGMIERLPSPSDRRTTDIRLTAEGEAAAREAAAQREQRHERMFAALSGQEKEALLALLERVNADWDRLYREDVPCAARACQRRGRGDTEA